MSDWGSRSGGSSSAPPGGCCRRRNCETHTGRHSPPFALPPGRRPCPTSRAGGAAPQGTAGASRPYHAVLVAAQAILRRDPEEAKAKEIKDKVQSRTARESVV